MKTFSIFYTSYLSHRDSQKEKRRNHLGYAVQQYLIKLLLTVNYHRHCAF